LQKINLKIKENHIFFKIKRNKKKDLPKMFVRRGKMAKPKVTKHNVLSVVFGALTGLINGLFGGGGGMVVVPTLTGIFNKEQKTAQATAIFIILPVSFLSAVIYSSFGNLDHSVLIPTVIGVVIGGIVGAKFLKTAQNDTLFKIFYASMFLAGLKMLF